MCKKRKESAVYNLPYDRRILNYNLEKQSALSIATTPEEADRVIRYLRKKWRV